MKPTESFELMARPAAFHSSCKKTKTFENEIELNYEQLDFSEFSNLPRKLSENKEEVHFLRYKPILVASGFNFCVFEKKLEKMYSEELNMSEMCLPSMLLEIFFPLVTSIKTIELFTIEYDVTARGNQLRKK